jgi:hypothetical protein
MPSFFYVFTVFIRLDDDLMNGLNYSFTTHEVYGNNRTSERNLSMKAVG